MQQASELVPEQFSMLNWEDDAWKKAQQSAESADADRQRQETLKKLKLRYEESIAQKAKQFEDKMVGVGCFVVAKDIKSQPGLLIDVDIPGCS